MSKRIILVPGTFANSYAPDMWWYLGSPFCQGLEDLGYMPLSFAWRTSLDGVAGKNNAWIHAGKRLAKQLVPGDRVIAHSHGGQVVAYALEDVRDIAAVFTLATPVRDDVPYKNITLATQSWTHVYGDHRDWWQLLGSLLDGAVHWNRREMPGANKNIQIAGNHTDTHEVTVWDKYELWSMLG